MIGHELAAATASDAVPDAVGTVVAWRAWSLARGGDGRLTLRPAFQGTEPWPAMTPARARCQGSSGRDHRAPDPECRCGLYAVPDPALLPGRHVSVVGTVSLWGTVVEHDRGFRAEFAYPESLRLVCARCGRLRSLGSMVVREHPGEPGRLAAVCARHLRGRRGPARSAREVQADLQSTYGVDPLPQTATRALRRWRSGILGLLGLPKTRTTFLLAVAFVVALAALSLAAGGLAGLRAGA